MARAVLAAVLVLPLGLFLAAPAQAATYECTPMSSDVCKSLRPVAECVWDNGDGTRTALWGWDNPTNDSAFIPASNKNNLSPGASDQGQPTLFGPGRQRNIFVTTFTGTQASWHLGNNDADVTSATALCSTKPVSQLGSMRALGVSVLLLVLAGLTVFYLRNRRHGVARMKVLAIGAHPDDIELGCAGALLRHIAAGDEVTMLVMTPGEMGPQGLTSRVREQEAAAAVIGAKLIWGTFEDGNIPSGREPSRWSTRSSPGTGADVIYAHAPNDTHQDHVATSLAALAAGRRLARVLFYQSPSTTSFNPTVFVDVERTLGDKLARCGRTGRRSMQCAMVDLEAVEAGARYWGSRAKISYAEAFETPRFVWDIRHAVARHGARPRDGRELRGGGAGAVGRAAGTSQPRQREVVNQLAPGRRPADQPGGQHGGAVDLPLLPGGRCGAGGRVRRGLGDHRDFDGRQPHLPRLLPAPRRLRVRGRALGARGPLRRGRRSTWSSGRTSA